MERTIASFSAEKFNTWIPVYAMLALGCNIVVVESLCLTWPLMLEWGEEREDRKAAMKQLYRSLYALFWDIFGSGYRIANLYYDGRVDAHEECLIIYSRPDNIKRFCIQWVIPEGSIHIELTTNETNQCITIRDCVSTVGDNGIRYLSHPLHLWLSQSIHAEEGRPVTLIIDEPLGFLIYTHQIRRALSQFMALTPWYWREHGELPKTLKL
jgi:hypothetical protein